jgi:hypothetical protein
MDGARGQRSQPVDYKTGGQKQKRKGDDERKRWEQVPEFHCCKKYSPPHPLDTKGCCSPQNNP